MVLLKYVILLQEHLLWKKLDDKKLPGFLPGSFFVMATRKILGMLARKSI